MSHLSTHWRLIAHRVQLLQLLLPQCNSMRPTQWCFATLAPSLFVVYQTPDDSPSAAREALHQVNLVMEQVKVMHEASQVAYNTSTALQTNVKVS